MFGLSFGELCVVLAVAVIVLGPRELPRYLRKAGQFAGKMRTLAYDMRQKSGIDEVLHNEGIVQDIAQIRQLARGELGGVMTAVRSTADALRPSALLPAAATSVPYVEPSSLPAAAVDIDRQREYPTEGPDAYGALPDTALVYADALPPSLLADDPLYARGEVR